MRLVFSLTRLNQSYIVKYILPLAFLVLLSQLSYWIDPMCEPCFSFSRSLPHFSCHRSPPARVGSSFTLVLAVVTFNVTIGGDLPKLNYLTLIDWYVHDDLAT